MLSHRLKLTGALAGLALTGCASISNVQTADTLGKGGYQIGFEPGVLGATSVGAVPHIDASMRYGVTDGIDIGARAGFSFLELQSKFLLTKPGDPNLAISLAPTVGGLVVGGAAADGSSAAGILNIGVPLLVGFKTKGGSEFVLGPRLQNWVIFAGGSTTGGSSGSAAVYVLGGGLSVGFAARLSDSFILMPEIAAVVPIIGGASVSGSSGGSAFLGQGVEFQFKLGLLLGKFRSTEAPLPPPPPPPEYAPQPVQPVPAAPPPPEYVPPAT
jgi:hypothetical protein